MFIKLTLEMKKYIAELVPTYKYKSDDASSSVCEDEICAARAFGEGVYVDGWTLQRGKERAEESGAVSRANG